MLNNFYSDEAVKYNSIEIAVLLQKFREIAGNNRVLNLHLSENENWVKVPEHSFSELFPYIEIGKLFRILYRMKDIGLIKYKKDQSNIHWILPIEQSIEHSNNVVVEQPVTEVKESRSQKLWSEISPELLKAAMGKLIQKFGYDENHFLEIWHTFSAGVDSRGEFVPPRFDQVEKRFIAYASKVQMNMSHANRRYMNTTKATQQAKQESIAVWMSYVDNPPEDIHFKVNTTGLNTPFIKVWNNFVAKCYEKDIPLKSRFQVEVGFQNYIDSWVRNESKADTRPSYRKRNVNFDDTSWADDIDLEGL